MIIMEYETHFYELDRHVISILGTECERGHYFVWELRLSHCMSNQTLVFTGRSFLMFFYPAQVLEEMHREVHRSNDKRIKYKKGFCRSCSYFQFRDNNFYERYPLLPQYQPNIHPKIQPSRPIQAMLQITYRGFPSSSDHPSQGVSNSLRVLSFGYSTCGGYSGLDESFFSSLTHVTCFSCGSCFHYLPEYPSHGAIVILTQSVHPIREFIPQQQMVIRAIEIFLKVIKQFSSRNDN